VGATGKSHHLKERIVKKLLCGAFLVVAAVVVGRTVAEDKKLKDIETIMEEAHKGGKDSFIRKVASGEATKADAQKLLSLYEDLAKNKPPKGDLADWKKRTAALIPPTKKLVADPTDKEAGKALLKAANCMGCHDAHKAE
jgi:hypothetical protein